MDSTKSPLASVTVWAGLIGIAAALVGLFGYTISAEDQATLALIASQVAGAVSGALAIWGRVKATKRLG